VRLDELDYDLPERQIAQRPPESRGASRLLEVARTSGNLEDRLFVDLPSLLQGDELLVLNNARVIPARLYGRRAGLRGQRPSRATAAENLTGKIEVLLTRRVGPDVWEVLVRPGRKLPKGELVRFGEGELEAEIVERGELGVRTVRLAATDGQPVDTHIERLGHMPLPPYIHRADENVDRERYQTVFAKKSGAIAAPTAGLHFTPEILEQIRRRGVEISEITLHVGLGTFQPIHAEELEGHAMHAETYEISEEAAEKIEKAQSTGRRIVAIGTTVVRALEDAARKAATGESPRLLRPGAAEAKLFIFPGFHFRVVDGLLTNFHLPRSTLLALVCAFAGRERVLAAYTHAVRAGYRFYTYGDCMLIR
jgi:S-adenosylmethionine:tRNA ribosyltransferase-isomerase